MNKEIELKARVTDPENLKTGLEQRYGDAVNFYKDDIYFLYKNIGGKAEGQAVRLRRTDGENIVTAKRKTLSNGIEINDELEFSVGDGEAFLDFLTMTGASEWVSKKKSGWRFTSGEGRLNAVIELCDVESLGWFIEIEVVLDTADADDLKAAELKIKSILAEMNISEDMIEPRYYSDMLLEKKSNL